MENQEEVDRKDLKIQALLEKVSALTTNYENQLADARVDITILTNTVEGLRGLVAQLQSQGEEVVPEEEATPADDTD